MRVDRGLSMWDIGGGTACRGAWAIGNETYDPNVSLVVTQQTMATLLPANNVVKVQLNTFVENFVRSRQKCNLAAR